MRPILAAAALAFALHLPGGAAQASATIAFSNVAPSIAAPVGLDYSPTLGRMMVSVNYPNGLPNNLATIRPNGTLQTFSGASGYTDEVNLAIVRAGHAAGWTLGDVYAGTGVDGVIARISADGSVVNNAWTSLPGSANGLFRGDLHFDRTGLWGGDLIGATTLGQIWRIDAAGTATQVASLPGQFISGFTVVPNDPRYGGMAGKIVAGNENNRRLYLIDSAGGVQSFLIDFALEDLDIITGNENLYAAHYGQARVVGAAAGQFAALAGELLAMQEFPDTGTSGLALLKWNADANAPFIERVGISGISAVTQWEQLVFSPAGIGGIAAIEPVPEPGTYALMALGLAALGWTARRRRS